MGAIGEFSPATRAWFEASFGEPTPAQSSAWPAIAAGDHVLLCAPTGSGKTLAAFLSAIDRWSRPDAVPPDEPAGTRVLYVSPLRALAVDVDKNLRSPLRGSALAADRLGLGHREPTVGVRTGDTPADERRRLRRHPPDILITTPESLYLLLTSAARETLATVETVIVDEIHAVAATKRGSHLAVSLERLERVCSQPPQRIGLSATQRPLEEVAHFLGGNDVADDGSVTPRPVTIVDAGVGKELDLEIVVPVDDMADLGSGTDGGPGGDEARRSIWPSIHPRLLELVEGHRSTLVFVNARRLAERLASRLNQLAIEGENLSGEASGTSPEIGRELVKAHHGSLSREQRLVIEDQLKRGELRGLVATSSLELGIDMGAVDLVVQVESPGAVSSGLQRIGRAGHQFGAPSVGRIFPKHRGDLVECAVVTQRMLDGEIEHTRYLRTPLDVLAQQLVAACALDEWGVDELLRLVRGAAPFGDLSDELLASVLDLLDGRYPSEEFSELRPRLVWDRAAGVVRGRSGAQRLAVTNPGTIPDRGLFGVFLPDGTRVGELDEEMVYESRPGETFLLGATTWRIEDITFDRVIVTPAPGVPGRMPFWHGDGPGRPVELGRAVGAFVREIRAAPREEAVARLRERHRLDERAARNLLAFLDDQAEATGAVPDDRTLVVERFRDEIGDWRVCIHSPFGARVNAPWAIVLRDELARATSESVEVMWSDDGIIIRLPEAVDELAVDQLLPDPDEVAAQVVACLPGTAMFAARFRECAARALLLPRRRLDRRTPLWQQRQRAADLLAVASRYPDFPMLLEATRECVNDVFDVGALADVLRSVADRRVRVVEVETPVASPMAESLLFGWIAVYMYEGDAPLAERRAAALALDRDLLRDLLGEDELRSLVDPELLELVEDELQCRVEGRRARDADEVHDLLRRLGPLSAFELGERTATDLDLSVALGRLGEERRAIEVTIAGEPRWADAGDAGRLRDALGTALPLGLPAAYTEPVDAPLAGLVERHARTHGPFTAAEVAARLGAGIDAVRLVLAGLESGGRLVRGEFRPGGAEREWCDPDVLRVIRRRTLARLRHEVEPVEPVVLTRFLLGWQGIGAERRGVDALADVVAQLEGVPLVASTLDDEVLGQRLADHRPGDLDALCVGGEVVWVGAGAIGARDGRIRLARRDRAATAIPVPEELPEDPHHRVILDHLDGRGASFWPELVGAVGDAGLPYDEEVVLAALWDLVWAGAVTNDSLAPLRAAVTASRSRGRGRARRPRAGRLVRQGPPAAAGRWSSVAPLLSPPPTPTEASLARAQALLDRYGVVTREMALAEGIRAGFAGVYPVLASMEEQGKVRRGYFVAGLGAAQFASPGVVDRLRGFRDEPDRPEVVVLAATDPAQPYGAALPWPDSDGRPARAAGARVILADGRAVAHLDRTGRTISLLGVSDEAALAAVVEGLGDLARRARVEPSKVDGLAVGDHPLGAALSEAGWRLGYRGLRPPT